MKVEKTADRAIRSGREGRTYRMVVEWLDSIDSTNEELKRRVRSSHITSPKAIRAGEQTAGRGRRGRTWFNTHDAILLSIALPLNGIEPERFPLIGHAAAVAVCAALRDIDANVDIKWPNDILIDGAKVCGILSDLVFDKENMPCAVVGIGVNVNGDAVTGELKYPAITLKTALGHGVDSGMLTRSICDKVLEYTEWLHNDDGYDNCQDGVAGLLNEYRARCSMIGHEIIVVPNSGHTWWGMAAGVADDGRLIVIDEFENTRMIDAADVSVRRGADNKNFHGSEVLLPE